MIGVGTRFQDFTTGSWALFANPERKLVSLNVTAYDAMKHGAVPLMADARVGLKELGEALGGYTSPGKTDGAQARTGSARSTR